MANRSWSTTDIAEPERFAYWHDAVSQAVLNVSPESAGEMPFGGDITSASFNDLRFASFTSTPHDLVRTRTHISRSADEHYLVSFQQRGVTRMSQDGEDCELEPGDIGIIDGMRPFRIRFPREVERIVAVIPHRLLAARAPWLKRRSIARLSRNPSLLAMGRHYAELLAGSQIGSLSEATVLCENLCNLIAFLSSPDRDGVLAGTGGREAELQAMFSYLRANLMDPDLSPRMLAAHMRVSVRTVHKRFEEIEQSFGKWVLEQRLSGCRRVLGDPLYAGRTISELVFAWGFNDLSHFTKVFGATYGMSPGAYRKTKLAEVLAP